MSLYINPNQPWLAPLAGFSDLPFRLLCRHWGAAVAVTEMISVKGLVYNGRNTLELLRTEPVDQPLVVQIFGGETKFIGAGLEILLKKGFSYFDLNAGCSVSKVLKTGSGAALLLNPQLLLEILELMISLAGKGNVGVKLRLGFANGENTALNIAPELDKIGLGWVTLHPRSAKAAFSGQAKWAEISKLKSCMDVPVIASGDLFYAEDALRCLQETKADGVMFARGALSDPRIFQRFRDLMDGNTPVAYSFAEALENIREHAALQKRFFDSRRGLLRMRGAGLRYVKNFPGAKELRCKLSRCESWDELEDLVVAASNLDLPVDSEHFYRTFQDI